MTITFERNPNKSRGPSFSWLC